jgi:hypothetical protein
MAIAGDERSRRLAEGLRAVAADEAGWRPPAPPWSRAASRAGGPGAERSAPPPGADDSELTVQEQRDRLETLQRLFDHLVQRLGMERTARLAGRIAEADFYVRQITAIEISLDLLVAPNRNLVEVFGELAKARGDRRLPCIAETVMSRLLDDARRVHWANMGEPVRPEPPPDEEMIDRGWIRLIRRGFATEDGRSFADWKALYADAAKAQVEWEAKARAEAAAWRARLESEGKLADELDEGEGGEPDQDRD